MGIVRSTACGYIVAGFDGYRGRKVKVPVESICPAGLWLRINYGVSLGSRGSMKTTFARKRRGMRARAGEQYYSTAFRPVHGTWTNPIDQQHSHRADNDSGRKEVGKRLRACSEEKGRLAIVPVERTSSLSEP